MIIDSNLYQEVWVICMNRCRYVCPVEFIGLFIALHIFIFFFFLFYFCYFYFIEKIKKLILIILEIRKSLFPRYPSMWIATWLLHELILCCKISPINWLWLLINFHVLNYVTGLLVLMNNTRLIELSGVIVFNLNVI